MAGYGIYRFQNLPTNQKENLAKQTSLYNKKNSPLKPKTLCLSHFSVIQSESTLFEPKFFVPDNQDPIFAGYGYNLHVIFIYV